MGLVAPAAAKAPDQTRGYFDLISPPPAPVSPSPGGTGPGDDDEFAARKFWDEWTHRGDEPGAQRERAEHWPEEVAFFRRVIQHGRASRDAEVAALLRFVEWARDSGYALVRQRVIELEAELAKAAGGGGTEG